jgi:histidine triad (HIT) family protein
MQQENCIFCKIASGEIPSYKVWEDAHHLAFLDIAPAVEGMTLVVPKNHHTSYFAETDANVLCSLMEASQKVAKLLEEKLDNVLRVKLVFEGMDVDHLHAKLYPMFEGKSTPETGGEKAGKNDLERVLNRLTG